MNRKESLGGPWKFMGLMPLFDPSNVME